MKLVGTAIQDYGGDHDLDCIGIVPWGAVGGSETLVDSDGHERIYDPPAAETQPWTKVCYAVNCAPEPHVLYAS